ncbi:hypothetical protein EZS27_015497 [termite gut metagenome]|uniref:IPT/TIG domain-containing protein n=1 Tax=termite gut metagenome TaxID=433724 RepID=A0A5J4RTH6_9ZZZZ
MNNKKVHLVSLAASCCLSFFLISSCGDTDKKGTTVYDPTKPVTITSFYPDSGRIAEKVIFTGENFGSEPDSIRVWFNEKRGRVIGANGHTMYVVVPRTPGDTCTVTVQIGNHTQTLEQKFRYKISVSVSTICGNGVPEFRSGDLASAQMRPWYLAVDNEENIFVVQRGDGFYGLIRVNEEENIVEELGRGLNSPNVLTVDRETGMITVPADDPREILYTADPQEGWAVRTRNMKLDFDVSGGNTGIGRYKHAMAFCQLDGKVYTRYRSGDIAKIDPVTYKTEKVYQTDFGDVYGLAFHPLHPELLYLAMTGEVTGTGNYAHSICTIDVTNPEHSFRRLTAPNASGGFRDGEIELARFNNPCQIYFDPDGTLYVADMGNHCIRKITPSNLVQTVIGIPGSPGSEDGNTDEARFNQPRGLTVNKEGTTIYVADFGNARLRKLAIE